MTMFTARLVTSPIGPIEITSDARAIHRVRMLDTPATDIETRVPDDSPAAEAVRQLAQYFAGQRQVFDLNLAPAGTAFQRAVWARLSTIGHGETATYAAIAEALGRSGAARAVGAANARNPVPLLIPCHRVIGTGGRLTGYAGGMTRKTWLLRHEGLMIDTAHGEPRLERRSVLS